jgi:pimeloyl-ACP methyl ester carboxylesterase
MSHVTSKDGTRIAYERRGDGPPLILVDGALCSRAFGPSEKLAGELAARFSVYRYDRRGRGESGDTAPYAKQREVEDLAALIAEAGGRASLLGLSSGAALALEAAASGLSVSQVAAYEPPYVSETHRDDFESELKRRIAKGDRGGAVKYFMGPMVGAPGFVVVMMQLMPWVWRKLRAVAHTLPYDAAVMAGFAVPKARLAEIRTKTVVMYGGKTTPRLKTAAETVAAAVPGAELRALPGQDHNVAAPVLASAVFETFAV